MRWKTLRENSYLSNHKVDIELKENYKKANNINFGLEHPFSFWIVKISFETLHSKGSPALKISTIPTEMKNTQQTITFTTNPSMQIEFKGSSSSMTTSWKL